MKLVNAALLPLAAALAVDQVPLEDSNPTSNPKPLTLESIPKLGFGTWNLDKSNASDAVSWAIYKGYRHIDCAAIYGNEKEVGLGIEEGLLRTGLKREDLWITSKLWNNRHGLDWVEVGLDQTLKDLRLEYLDLYHMHWPVQGGNAISPNEIEYRETWSAMALEANKGKSRHIGVSNFSPTQLEDLLKHTTYKPDVHQFETHPYLQQSDWLDWHHKHGIHVTAYSPLGGTNPTYDEGELAPLLHNKVVEEIAKKRDCTPAQVSLAWGLSRGTSVIPKAQQKDHITENFKAKKCELKKKDLKKLNKLGKEFHRYNNPSESWNVKLFEGLEDSKGKHRADT